VQIQKYLTQNVSVPQFNTKFIISYSVTIRSSYMPWRYSSRKLNILKVIYLS